MKPLDSAIFASAVLVRFLFRSSNPAHRRNPEKRDTRRFGGGTFWRSDGDEGGLYVHGGNYTVPRPSTEIRLIVQSVLEVVRRHAARSDVGARSASDNHSYLSWGEPSRAVTSTS